MNVLLQVLLEKINLKNNYIFLYFSNFFNNYDYILAFQRCCIQNWIFLLEEVPRFQLTEYYQALNHNEQCCLNVICLKRLKSVKLNFMKVIGGKEIEI